MKQYKGFYIDGAIFTCEADIDAHIKASGIRAFKIRMELFAYYVSLGKAADAMSMSIQADNEAMYLVKHCGMTWDEIDQIELEAIA